jgi:uncharacterized protein
MMSISVKLVIAATFMMLWSSCNTGSSPQNSTSTGRIITLSEVLEIADNEQKIITAVRVAIVNTPEERNLGLMDVRQLDADAGMLFIFDTQERLSFWMANTPLPLDLIFADEQGVIVHIHQNAQPFSLQNIDSVYPALYVLEVNAGFTVNLDIQPGHRLLVNSGSI